VASTLQLGAQCCLVLVTEAAVTVVVHSEWKGSFIRRGRGAHCFFFGLGVEGSGITEAHASKQTSVVRLDLKLGSAKVD
jgi:hypothetical protein